MGFNSAFKGLNKILKKQIKSFIRLADTDQEVPTSPCIQYTLGYLGWC